MKYYSHHILIVEDEPIDLNCFRLTNNITRPLRISSAHTAIETLAYCRQLSFDLIFLDIDLPDMDGFRLIEQIRLIAGYQHTPIIASTAYDHQTLKEEIKHSSLNGFYTKPFTKSLIKKLYRTHLMSHAA